MWNCFNVFLSFSSCDFLQKSKVMVWIFTKIQSMKIVNLLEIRY